MCTWTRVNIRLRRESEGLTTLVIAQLKNLAGDENETRETFYFEFFSFEPIYTRLCTLTPKPFITRVHVHTSVLLTLSEAV